MAVQNTSSAYDLQSFERTPKKQPEPKLRVVKNRNKKRSFFFQIVNARSVGTFFLVVMVFALIVYNQTCLNEMTGRINSVNSQIAELKGENTRLNSMIENTLSLQNVAEMAQDMGMKKLDKYQIEYVSLYKENRIEVIESSVDPSFSELVKMSVNTAISQIKEYIGIS